MTHQTSKLRKHWNSFEGHCFYRRPIVPGEIVSSVFRFPPVIAPIRCTVFPLLQREDLNALAKRRISTALTRAGVSNKIDLTGSSIGKEVCENRWSWDRYCLPSPLTTILRKVSLWETGTRSSRLGFPLKDVVACCRPRPWKRHHASHGKMLQPNSN